MCKHRRAQLSIQKANASIMGNCPLFADHTHPLLLGGDFNCVLRPVDPTGHFTNSTALAEIVRGLRLTDMWEQDLQHPTYAHYTPTCASRLDSLYMSTNVKGRKVGIEIVPTAFTDHHVVVLRLSILASEQQPRRGMWKRDPTIGTGSSFKERFQAAWEKWRGHKRYYFAIVMW